MDDKSFWNIPSEEEIQREVEKLRAFEDYADGKISGDELMKIQKE